MHLSRRVKLCIVFLSAWLDLNGCPVIFLNIDQTSLVHRLKLDVVTNSLVLIAVVPFNTKGNLKVKLCQVDLLRATESVSEVRG